MRILFCTRYIDHILYFFLRRVGAAADLEIACSREDEWTARLARDGMRVRLLAPRSRFDARFRREIGQLYARSPFELLHCFHGNAELANSIQWADGRVPIIGYRAYIGHLGFHETPAAYWSVRHPRMAAVVALSRAVKEYLESFRFLRPRNVHVIHHGIEEQWLRAEMGRPFGLREKLGIDEGALIVASMSNLRPYKRFDLVLSAARALAEQPIHFVHLGEDRGWRKTAASLRNVHFLGRLSSPWAALAEADVFASTAHNEAFGRANLEALACGKPLIGSATGGLLDLVEDNVNGRLFESKNAADFAAKVSFYERNRDAVRAHSAAALESVRSRFSSTAMAARYLALYSSVLAPAERAA